MLGFSLKPVISAPLWGSLREKGANREKSPALVEQSLPRQAHSHRHADAYTQQLVVAALTDRYDSRKMNDVSLHLPYWGIELVVKNMT